MDQRIGSTIHIAGLVKRILVLSIHIAATSTNDIEIWQYVLLPQGRAYWSLQYALPGDGATYWMKSIVLHIVLSKVWKICREMRQKWMPASKFCGLVSAMFSDEEGASLHLQYHYYYVLVTEATTAVDESGKTWQLLSNAWCYFLFLCSLLSAVSYITGGSSFWQHSRQLRLFIPSVRAGINMVL